jgi:hypothetical protein
VFSAHRYAPSGTIADAPLMEWTNRLMFFSRSAIVPDVEREVQRTFW